MAIQRGFEMVGLPTILITVSPNESKPMRPPRAVFPDGFKIGNVLGGPDQPDLQRTVLQTTIEYLNQLVMPGEITTLQFPDYVKLNGGPYYVE